MADLTPEYESLTSRLSDKGLDVARIERDLECFAVETPSWGYGDSGTRFATFPQPGRPRNVFEKLEDAAEVHRLTGSAPSVALHFPWDAVDDYAALRAHLGPRAGNRSGQPQPVSGSDYKLGSITHPDLEVRRALDHLLECVQIAPRWARRPVALVRRRHQLRRPGQPDRATRAPRVLARAVRGLPDDQELLVEYKPFEPAFYATDIADWGSAMLICHELGPRARVLVDFGHHLHGTNVEQIVALLAARSGSAAFTSTTASTRTTT